MTRDERFAAVFARLRSILATRVPPLVVIEDGPAQFMLARPGISGPQAWYGGVAVKKTYVSLHLIAVYVSPRLLDDISPQLLRRMQGKSCFNFTRVDEGLFAEVEALLGRIAAAYAPGRDQDAG